jgi:Secretion system C-terminal sorting domain
MIPALCLAMILHFSSMGQAPSPGPGGGTPSPTGIPPSSSGTTPGPNGTTLLYSTYDTLLSGIGYGTYNLTFPQWNPDSGTLAAVRIRALVTVQYGFTLKDVDVIPSTYTVSVGREDQFSSPALTTPYDSILERSIGTFPLNPGGSVVKSPFAFMDNYANTDSITDNTAPFLGSGRVGFTYSPITYTDVHTNNNSSYSYSAHVLDTIHFSVTYLYSGSGIVLAASLTSFSAVLVDQSTVQLAWTAVNEPAGRQYEVQAGRDGQQYATVTAPIPSGHSGGADHYQQNYKLPSGGALASGRQGEWFFRLKITDTGGNITYSNIREVTVDGQTTANTMTLYPNPAKDYFVTLSFGQAPAGNWQIDILNAGGSLVQRNTYPPSRTVQVDFQHRLAAGTYFVRATDQQTRKTYSSTLLVAGK